jgi:amino acid transporter
VAVGLNAWFWIWPTNNMVMSTRVMLAMSGDRLLPSFLARVSRSRGAPLAAIAVCYLGSLVMGWLYYFTDFAKLTLGMPLMTSIAFAASTLVGTLFPYLKSTRDIYAASPFARYRILGAPVITVCGAAGLVYFAIMFFLYLSDDRYGVNDPLSAVFILAAVATSGVIFWGFRRARRKKGLDPERLMRRIPSD